MDLKHQGRDRSGRLYSLSRVAFFATTVTAAVLLFNAALPAGAQSQTATITKKAAQISEKPKLPHAPVQVAMPAPPLIEYMPGLEEPLVATGPVSEGETKALRIALKEFHDAPAKAGPQGDYSDYARPLLAFIAAHPKSNWNSALQLNIGLGYYHAGYFSRAFAAFDASWRLGRDATDPHARLMVDRAAGELAKMHARVGHAKETEALLKDIGNRPIGGPATELVQGAREGLWDFHHNQGEAYLCGPRALRNVLAALKATPEQIKVAEDARSGPHGFSLTQLSRLADKAGLKYALVQRRPGQPIPVPSIINWKVHHYAAITGMQGGKYIVADPTFAGLEGSVLTAQVIDAEGSGYFLVPATARNEKAGWRSVAADSPQARAVYGMGNATDHLSGGTTGKEPGPCTFTSGNQNFFNNNSTCAPQPMTVATAQPMTVNLRLSDTPVGYRPQKGLPATTALTYNAREAEQPATFGFSNAGPKWSFSWMSYIQDDPVNVGASVTRVAPGGGGFENPHNYNSTTGTFSPETPDDSVLYRFPISGALNHYEHHLPDGSKELYTLSDGAATFPRKIFLTSVVDPQGNTTTLNYDASFRLTSVVDAMGRSTTFTYAISATPLLITQVTDPFGRTSQLTYDTSGRLASITDPIGITSSFTYSVTEPTFISQLTTPYGTSKFNDSLNPNDPLETATRSLTLTDPMGFAELYYFYQNSAITPASDPSGTIPTGVINDNGLLQWRNTYYWDKHAFAQGVTTDAFGNVISQDYTKARLAHWLHDSSVATLLTGRAVGSIKQPLERRVWHSYPSQGVGYQEGNLDRPAIQGRVLDDGTSQETRASYNAIGVISAYQDARGRYTAYGFAANLVDVTSVLRNKFNPVFLGGSSAFDTVAAFSYNTIHRPLTYTDESGKVWHYAWNAAGQRTSITDPNGKITTFNYDSVGRLSSIVNANSVTQVSYSYDSADRILTRTDSEGYVLTYAYDALDRITSVTYPDGTTDLYDYTFQSGPNMGTASLELRKHTDRLGRVTNYDFDADQRLISVTEPTSGASTRTTSYSYYENGTMKELTDANGNITHWDIDIESRPTTKIYAFGTGAAQTETYTYEPSTSRVKSITDANGQVKNFTYDKDDRVSAITYTGALNPTPNVTFTWDPIYERVKSMTDGLGTTNFTYGAAGATGGLKLASITGPFTNNTISLTYDTLSRLAGRTITGGNETFGYDLISRLTSHGTPLGSFTNTYLGQTDQMTGRSVTNGTVTVSTNWGYDTNANDRRLLSIANSGVTRSYTLGYGSGPVNPYDIMSISDTAATGHPFASQSHSYGYDNVDRLLSATSTTPGNYSYGYDNLDNATSVTDPGFGSTTPTYNALNQVQTFNTNTYTYDNNGNTTSDGLTKTYKWDAENRLIEIDYIGTTAKSQFQYDAMGRRTVDVETDALGGVTTQRFLWCGSRICQTRNGSDTVQSRILDEGEYNVVSTQKAVYMQDQLGSVRDVLDATTGNLLSSIDYSPYGTVTQSNGAFVPAYQYAQLLFHPQSSLYLSATRVYDGKRWINHDPIEEVGGLNLYSYGPNPANGLDPLGLYQWNVTIGLPFGWAFNFTLGQNSGQWNFGAYVGLGGGYSATYDPANAPCKDTGFDGGLKGSGQLGLTLPTNKKLSIGTSGSLTFGGDASVTATLSTPKPGFGRLGGTLSSTNANPQRTFTPVERANAPVGQILGGGASYFAGIGGTATWNGGGSTCGCKK